MPSAAGGEVFRGEYRARVGETLRGYYAISKMKEINLQKALNAKSDYSKEFTDYVDGLGKELSNLLNVVTIHDGDMNYKASQELKVYLNSKFENNENEIIDTIFCIRIFISSKGLFVAIRLNATIKKNIWVNSEFNNAPNKVNNIYDKLKIYFREKGYSILFDDLLEQKVPNVYREIDNQPATIFNVLFAEEF